MISILEDAPYYAFEVEDDCLNAYILSQDFHPQFLEKNQISYQVEEMELTG